MSQGSSILTICLAAFCLERETSIVEEYNDYCLCGLTDDDGSWRDRESSIENHHRRSAKEFESIEIIGSGSAASLLCLRIGLYRTVRYVYVQYVAGGHAGNFT